MKKLLILPILLMNINCYSYHVNNIGEIIYTKKDLIEIEIKLCNRLPLNKVFGCLMKIDNK